MPNLTPGTRQALIDRPYRSMIYMPGSNPRALEKAPTLDTDAIIFDLEDAVAPDAKIAARSRLYDHLAQIDHGARARIVRINALDTEWGHDDARAFADLPCEGLLLPKVDHLADLDALARLVPNQPLWAMIESPRGVLNAAEIARHPALVGFVLGTNDIAKDLGCRPHPNRLPLQMALQTCLMAARAQGIVCLDGVYNAFRDELGLVAECQQGRDLGFDGKTLIHPAQLGPANAAFSPSDAEIDLTERQIAAFGAVVAEGGGVAVVDGQIVENLHIVTARKTLAKAARGQKG